MLGCVQVQSFHTHPQPRIRRQLGRQLGQVFLQVIEREDFLLAPHCFAHALLQHLQRGAAPDHEVPEVGQGGDGVAFGDAAYLDVVEAGVLHLLFEHFGVFQRADGTLRWRQVGLDRAHGAEHHLHRGRLVYRRPAGDGDAAAGLERAVDLGETFFTVGEEHQAEQRERGVECFVGIGQGLRVAAVQLDVLVPGLLDLLFEHGEHGCREVDAVHLARLLCEPQRQRARPAGDIEHGGIRLEVAGGDGLVGELFERDHRRLGIAVRDEVPRFAVRERVAAHAIPLCRGFNLTRPPGEPGNILLPLSIHAECAGRVKLRVT